MDKPKRFFIFNDFESPFNSFECTFKTIERRFSLIVSTFTIKDISIFP